MKFILAKDHTQYSDYVAKKQGKFRYVSGVSDIVGIHGGDLTILIGAESRKDFSAILDYCARTNFDIKRKWHAICNKNSA